jgi:hypothetical protein
MRGLSLKTLTKEEDMAIDVLTTMKENKKWQLFFRFYWVSFVMNITSMMTPTDRDRELLRSLREASTPMSFMRIVITLLQGFNACSWAGSKNLVSDTFKEIVPFNDREALLMFNESLMIYCIVNPDTTDEMISNLYALRNYYLMKDELHRIFIDLNNDTATYIDECLPRELLEMLGFVELFSFL